MQNALGAAKDAAKIAKRKLTFLVLFYTKSSSNRKKLFFLLDD